MTFDKPDVQKRSAAAKISANLGPIITGRLTAPNGEFIEFGEHGTTMSEGIWKLAVQSLSSPQPAEPVLLDPPEYLSPDWTPPTKYVHDWRRYISEPLEAAWQTFTPEQRLMLAENAQRIADNEEWD